MKRKHLILTVTIAALLGISILTLIKGGYIKNTINPKYSQFKMNQISSLLNKSYLGELDQKKIEDSIYAGYVSGLQDPLTRYLNEEDFIEQQILEEGNYIGTGMEFQWGINGRYIIVTDVLKDSPAEKKNISQGDKITEIDGIKAILSNEGEIYKKLSYTGDKAVVYTLLNNEETKERKVSLKAQIVAVKSIDYNIIADNIGYISIFSVKKGASEELQKALEALKVEGAQKYNIDIRNTYSNNIEEIYKMCELFIDNQLIFKIKDKKDTVQVYKTDEAIYREPMALLINERTRGALEAFAAALFSSTRGQLVGVTTAGEGLVTETISLEDHTGIILSTGIIYTVEGQSLKDMGIEPHIPIKNDAQSIIELVTLGKLEKNKDLQLMEAIKALS